MFESHELDPQFESFQGQKNAIDLRNIDAEMSKAEFRTNPFVFVFVDSLTTLLIIVYNS